MVQVAAAVHGQDTGAIGNTGRTLPDGRIIRKGVDVPTAQLVGGPFGGRVIAGRTGEARAEDVGHVLRKGGHLGGFHAFRPDGFQDGIVDGKVGAGGSLAEGLRDGAQRGERDEQQEKGCDAGHGVAVHDRRGEWFTSEPHIERFAECCGVA